MARVVQRRSNPPYLVVLFVFLFVICAALAVLFYTYWSDETKQFQQARVEQDIFVKPLERRSEEVTTWGSRARELRKSVYALMKEDRDDLIHVITGDIPSGDTVSADQAIGLAKKVLEDTGATGGLATQVRQLYDDRQSAAQESDRLREQLAALTKRERDTREALGQADERFRTQAADLEGQMTALLDKVGQLSKSHDTRLAEAHTDWRKRLNAKDQELAARDEQIVALDKRVRDLAAMVDQLRQVMEGYRLKIGEGPQTLRPDGKILKAMVREGVVYIDIGRQDRVRIGMPFSVYSARKGVSEEGQGKASIAVTNVENHIAECHITRSVSTDPIVEGDLVANIAFDAIGTPVFVVAGQFDLDGDDQIEMDGTEQVKTMVADYGGKVAEEIDVTVDFVVLGTKPPLP